MKRVLLVKMSSLGDVVHALPAVTDAVAALGEGAVRFDWVVEEAFAAIPARHPGVERIIPIAWRRWRRRLGASRGPLRDFVRELRSRRYDLVLDAQGLLKSAAVTALARGECSAGPSRRSAREGAAAAFYRQRIELPSDTHAIERLRALFAEALGYTAPATAPDFGLTRPAPAPAPAAAAAAGAGGGRRRCVLLHGTTWDSKHWPEPFWNDLARRGAAAGFEVVLPWGNEPEQHRAERIADASGATVLPRLPLEALMAELSGAALVVGVDSGLAHLAAALAVPTLVIYGSTSSTLTGCRGRRVRNLQADFPCAPCLSRTCRYRGPEQHWQGRAVVPACYSRVPPERVWQAAEELVDADRLLHL